MILSVARWYSVIIVCGEGVLSNLSASSRPVGSCGDSPSPFSRATTLLVRGDLIPYSSIVKVASDLMPLVSMVKFASAMVTLLVVFLGCHLAPRP